MCRRKPRHSAADEDVEVVETAHLDLDEHLLRARLRFGPVLQLELVGPSVGPEANHPHGTIPLVISPRNGRVFTLAHLQGRVIPGFGRPSEAFRRLLSVPPDRVGSVLEFGVDDVLEGFARIPSRDGIEHEVDGQRSILLAIVR